ncbi:MAG TPA: phosphatidate cytidylyltransferase [Acidimicrobiia bacterium]|nr:phosphatidate cytidylyltransferase [Acidimicrobiia bacterium]
MSDWRDDHEFDPLDFDDEERPPHGESEGVRVLGPDGEATRPAPRPIPRRGRRAADDSEEFWGKPFADTGGGADADDDATWSASSQGLTEPESRPRTRRGRRAARRNAAATPPPPSRTHPEPPPDVNGPVQLPHWTEPPTGEVPSVISGEQPAQHDDDLESWRSRSGQTPRYRTDDSDWSEPDFSSPELLKDDSLALGALRDRDDDDDDDDDDEAAFEAEVAARRRRGNGRRRPVRRGRPPGTLEDDEPTAPVEEHGRPPDLVTRLLTAAAVAVVALIMLKLGRGATTILVAVIVGAAALELYEAFRRAGYHPATVIGLLGCVSIVGIAYTNGLDAFPLVTILVVAFTMLWYMLEVVKARPIVNIAITLLGFGYIGIFGAFAGLLLSAPDGTGFIIGLALCAIAYDVFGYFIGSQFGRSRMSPRLSPNKTWEGLVGGMVAAVVLGGIVGTLLAPWDGSISHGLALGLVVAIVAPIGDLCESMIKRDLGVKDLGTLLPGHGGVLDRFDAMLFCLPAAYYLAIQLKIV